MEGTGIMAMAITDRANEAPSSGRPRSVGGATPFVVTDDHLGRATYTDRDGVTEAVT